MIFFSDESHNYSRWSQPNQLRQDCVPIKFVHCVRTSSEWNHKFPCQPIKASKRSCLVVGKLQYTCIKNPDVKKTIVNFKNPNLYMTGFQQCKHVKKILETILPWPIFIMQLENVSLISIPKKYLKETTWCSLADTYFRMKKTTTLYVWVSERACV